MTIMAEAFAKAGIAPPRERIERMLRVLIEKHGSSNLPAVVADLARQLLASDAPVVWEFFRADREMRLWREAEDMMRRIRVERGIDAPASVTTNRNGQVSPAEKAGRTAPSRTPAGSGHVAPARNGRMGTAVPAPGPSPTLLRIAANSLLRSVTITGKPIGECTAGEARDWSRARGREARFAWLIAEGLQDGMIIGDFKTEADAEEAARLAREATNG